MAFHLASQVKLNISDAFKLTNPLLLASGPIALFIRRGGQKSFKKRINYYLPFVMVGLFFFPGCRIPAYKIFLFDRENRSNLSVSFCYHF